MTPTATTPPESAAEASPAARWPVVNGRLRQGLTLVLALPVLALAHAGGVAGVLGALLAAAAVFWWRSQPAATPPGSAVVGTPDFTPAASSPVGKAKVQRGAELMVAQVVPVWSRQIEVTRDAASDGLAGILNAFVEMNSALDTLVQLLGSSTTSAAPGAVHGAVQQQAEALKTLTAASRRAFDERDAMLARLSACAESLDRQQRLVQEVRELAKHARLVAFNASIEANRSRGSSATGSEGGGSLAVATELRSLSSRMNDTASKLNNELRQTSVAIRPERLAGIVHETTDEALQMEIELHARAALQGLLGSLGTALAASGDVQQASSQLRDQFEQVFVHFQFGDRVSQMLSIMANDMSNLVRWVETHPQVSQTDAAQWLAALEASYTMEEQRSHHHGNVHVERSTGVEFF